MSFRSTAKRELKFHRRGLGREEAERRAEERRQREGVPSAASRLRKLTRHRAGDAAAYHPTLLGLIERNFGLGNLKGASVVEFGAGVFPTKKMLEERFEAKVSDSKMQAQEIDVEFPGQKFGLMLGSGIFEHDAFEYEPGVRREHILKACEDARVRGGAKAVAEAVRKAEGQMSAKRVALLKKLAKHLKPGGWILVAGISSKVIFTQREAAQAGLKVKENNVPIGGIFHTGSAFQKN